MATCMEVTYQSTHRETSKIYQAYFKDCPDGRATLRSLFLYFLLIFAWLLLLLSIVVAIDKGRLAAVPVYVLCNGLYFTLANRVIRNWCVKRKLKALTKNHFDEDVSISLTDTSITVKDVDTTFCHKWKAIEAIEKTDLFLLFKATKQAFCVPSHAFANKEKYEEFYTLAQQYLKSDRKRDGLSGTKKPLGKARWLVPTLLFPLLGLVMLLSVGESQASRPIEDIEVVKAAMSFWEQSLQEDLSAVGYSLNTTGDFKQRVPKDKWQKIVAEVKHNIGELKDVEPLRYQYWSDPKKVDLLFFSVGMNTRPDTGEILLRVSGEEGSIYTRSFFVEDIRWKLNGFDVIATEGTRVTADSYSVKEDRELFLNGPATSCQIINDAEEAATEAVLDHVEN